MASESTAATGEAEWADGSIMLHSQHTIAAARVPSARGTVLQIPPMGDDGELLAQLLQPDHIEIGAHNTRTRGELRENSPHGPMINE